MFLRQKKRRKLVDEIGPWKLVRAGFHAILTCGTGQTSFQVDIDIYVDKLGQSGDRILSSHITNIYIKRNENVYNQGQRADKYGLV